MIFRTRLTWLDQLGQDVGYAVRQFARARGFTTVVVLTLALGIGATTAIYSVVDTVLLNPIPGADADRTVQIGEMIQYSNRPTPDVAGLGPATFTALESTHRDFFADVAWAEGLQLDLRGEEFSTMVGGYAVSENFFSLFGVRAQIGRTFTKGEAVPLQDRMPAKDAVIVISDAWWRSDFGRNPAVLGQTVELSGKRFTIVGVMPAYFQFPGGRFWMPAEPMRPQGRRLGSPNTTLIARLKPGVSVPQAQAMLDTVAQQLLQDYPAGDGHYGDYWRQRTALGRVDWQFWCRPLRESLQMPIYSGGGGYDELRRTLLGFLTAIGFVLAIVCANVANLTLARTERRQHELAVRAALGAGRGRLTRQLLTENLLLAGLGGLCGLLVTYWAIPVLAAFNTMPRLRPIEFDGRVLGVALAVTLFTGVIFGLAPAWQAGRVRVNERLAQGGLGSTAGRRGNRLRGGLVVTEVALAVVLLTGAGLMIQSVVRLLRVDPGFDPANLVSVSPDFTGRANPGLATREKRNVFVDQLRERFAALPGVAAVGLFKDNYWEEKFTVAGRTGPVLLCGAHVGVEEADYFRAARIAQVAGRGLGRGDIGQNIPTVVVNETMAELCWPGRSAIGQKFRAVDRRGQPTYEVVGVVRDARLDRLNETVRPIFYRPFSEAPPAGARDQLIVRTERDPALLIAAMRSEIRALNPDMRTPWFGVFRQILYDGTQAQRTYRNYLMVFAGVGLVLAALGIYGVLAYSVAQRTREIGIRMAIGADRRAVIRLVMGEGTRLIAAGIAVGLLAAFWLTKLLRQQLFEVSPTDPGVFIAVVVVLSAVALVACWLPARRAAKTDPMVALRAE